MNPLADKDFLRELDQNREREVFAKIVSLDYDENPIEEIKDYIRKRFPSNFHPKK